MLSSQKCNVTNHGFAHQYIGESGDITHKKNVYLLARRSTTVDEYCIRTNHM